MSIATAQLEIRKGAVVTCGGQEHVIVGVSGLNQVIAKNLDTGDLATLAIAQLLPPPPKRSEPPPKNIELEGIPKEQWDEAQRRLKIITPLLTPQAWGSAPAKSISEKHEISITTLYRWRNDYLNSGLLSSLLPFRPDGGKGKTRLKDARVEEALRLAIDDYYLKNNKPSLAATWEHLDGICQAMEISTPHPLTLRTRIKSRDKRSVVAARQGEYAASMLCDPSEGKIGDAEWPLALVLVDHTELPVIIVDEVTRRSIRRPWVTFGIDAHTRVVPGMYLTLDPPSAMSAGMCLSHAILPKEKWLAERGIEDVEWPCWGVMGRLHMDNAKEFRGDMLKVACAEYAIDLELRPVKKPHYGGYIERLMGTVSEELKKVAGTTFSGPAEKGLYDSEGNAVMTLAELERWLIYFLAKYHNRLHGGIGTTPLQKYREGLLGVKGKPGRGLPARRLDEEKVRIDFMPFIERTVQDYGVAIDDVHYFSDILRPWVNAPDPDNPRLKRKFRFRRDPRDISELYFFEPNAQRYYAIPYRDLSQPPISLWEMRDAKRELKNAGVKHDERQVFQYVSKMREEVSQAAEKTKSARRKHQKTLEHAKARERKKKELPTVSASSPKPAAPPPAISGYDPTKIIPYADDD
jgi:putative transposase